VTALELAEPAFGYLQKNIRLNGSPVQAVQADLAAYTHAKPLDLLLSNPPYIPTKAIATLQPEVRLEPRTALDGGADGLDFYRAIARLYAPQIKPGGWVCLEVGVDQSEQVQQILRQNGFGALQVKEDLGKMPRVVYARRLYASN
jgi:Methylase of polypeptide chain release factors